MFRKRYLRIMVLRSARGIGTAFISTMVLRSARGIGTAFISTMVLRSARGIGTAFISTMVQRFAAERNIKWTFNTPRAPWKGGFY